MDFKYISEYYKIIIFKEIVSTSIGRPYRRVYKEEIYINPMI